MITFPFYTCQWRFSKRLSLLQVDWTCQRQCCFWFTTTLSDPFQTIGLQSLSVNISQLAQTSIIHPKANFCQRAFKPNPWQKTKKTLWGFHPRSYPQNRRWGGCVGWVSRGSGLKWKLIRCEIGLEANPLDLSKRKTYHMQGRIWCRQYLGERNLTCCSLKWLLTALRFIVPSLFLFHDEVSTNSIRESQ